MVMLTLKILFYFFQNKINFKMSFFKKNKHKDIATNKLEEASELADWAMLLGSSTKRSARKHFLQDGQQIL